MGEACSTHWRNAYKMLVGKSEGKKSREKRRSRCEVSFIKETSSRL